MAALKKKKRRETALKPILKVGRPTKYKPIYARHAAEICEAGGTDREVADYLGIGDTTLYRWRWAYPEFRKALYVGKAAADDRVEMSLYRRATGYSFDSVHFSSFEGSVTQTPFVEHVPPDPGSIKLWLTNRRRDQWREKVDVEQSGSITVVRRDPTERPEGYQRKGKASV